MGHVLMDHREGLAVDVEVTEANGFAEREAALAMLDRHPSQQQRTVAADKAYDSADFIADCRERAVTPHVAMNITEKRGSAIDARTTRHAGYLASQRIRKRIEECFGWGKDGRPMRKMKVVGKDKVTFLTTLTVSCYTLLRVAKLRVGPGRRLRRRGVCVGWAGRADEDQSDEQTPRSKEPEPMRVRKMKLIGSWLSVGPFFNSLLGGE